jgi:hypothetical protein
MKKTLLSLCALALIGTGTSSAQVNIGNFRVGDNLPSNYEPKKFALPTSPSTSPSVLGSEAPTPPATQALNFQSLFTVAQPFFASYVDNHTSMVYDPTSKVLGVIRTEEVQGTGSNFGSRISAYVSTNGGTSFLTTPRVITTSNTNYSGMAQLGIANPKASTAVADLLFFTFIRSYPAATQYRYDGTKAFYLFEGQQASLEVQAKAPQDNNPSQLEFDGGALKSFNFDGVHGYVLGSRLRNPATPNNPIGNYGLLAINSNFATESPTDDDIQSRIPTTWGLSQFRPSPTSTYNGAMQTGVDSEGSVYAVINAMFADDINTRIPAVSKSVDFGKIWSEFNRMPKDLLASYAQSRNGTNLFPAAPYDQDAMIVTGNNRFSYFFPAFVVTGANNTIVSLDIVEVENNNNQWSIRTVGTAAGSASAFSVSDSLNSTVTPKALVPIVIDNPGGFELDAAITEDGKDIVVKWVAANPNMPIIFNPPMDYRTQNNQGELVVPTGKLDTIFASDIYIATRSMSSQTWGSTINLTNDKAIDRGTEIPTIVPSINQIPLTAHRAVDRATFTSTTNPLAPILRAASQDAVNFVVSGSISTGSTAIPQIYGYVLARPSNVNDSHSEITEFSMKSVQPNPADREASVVFNSEVNGVARIAIFNTLGEQVQVVYEGAIEQGLRSFTFPTQGISNGAYFVNLSINGKTQTMPMMIAR